MPSKAIVELIPRVGPSALVGWRNSFKCTLINALLQIEVEQSEETTLF